MDVTPLSDGLVRITRENEVFLGISTGISKKGFHLTKLSDRRSSSGMLVHGNVIEEWPIEGFAETEGSVYLTGKYQDGVTLSEVLRTAGESGLVYLRRLAAAFLLMKERHLPLFRVHTNGILFSGSDEVTFLPPHSMNIINKHHPISYQIAYHEFCNHPDLKEEDNLSFFLGVCAHQLLTGRAPFTGEDESDLHENIRSGTVLAPALVRPELQPQLSDFIVSALTGSGGNRPAVDEWLENLSAWIDSGTVRTLTPEERLQILSQADEILKKQVSTTQRRHFLRKHGVRMGVIAAVTLVIIWVAGSVIGNILKPRATHGFPPAQVVQTFYSSINTLDHTLMEDCVIGKAGKPFIDEVMNYYVITRMRYSVEGTMGFVDAVTWVKNGRQQPPQGTSIYGVTDLQVAPVTSPMPEEKVFAVSYERWAPSPGEPTSGTEPVAVRSAGFRVQERISLKLDKGDWVIYRIERISEEPLGTVSSAL